MAKFSDLVDRKAEEIQRPPVMPIGIYAAQITKPYATVEITGKDGTPYERIEFPCSITAPVEVDEDDLAEYGSVANQLFRVDFLLNTLEEEHAKREMTLFRVKSFLESAGIQGDTFGDLLANCVGGQFGVEVGHRPDPNNPDVVYLDVKRTFEL